MSSLFTELRRRNVFRVGIAYLVVSWLVVQVADVMIDNIGAPDWLFGGILLVLGVGFPVVLIFAWAFELTPEGLKKEKDVDRSQSIAPQTGRKLDRAIIALLVLVAGYFIWESRFSGKDEATVAETAPAKTPIAQLSAEPAPVPATTDDQSIAVLPFANRSNREDDLFFTDGIHDDLLTQLAKIQGLKVISRTSVMEYRNTTKKIPEIARELGVATILEGGIQRAGDRVRINAQLIDVATDEHLWAETFDREMTVDNIFDIQTEITRQIVSAVRGEISEEETTALGSSPTDNLDAYEAYLHALSYDTRSDERESLEAVRKWALRATELDPDFADAWALLVRNQAVMAWFGYQDENQASIAKSALDRLMLLAPESPSTLAAQGEYLYRINTNYGAALKAFQAASAALPNDADLTQRLATIQRRVGRYDEAIETYKKAIELAPNSVSAREELLITLGFVRRWPELEALCQQYLKRFPENGQFKVMMAMLEMSWHGDLDAAQEWLNRASANDGFGYLNTRITLGFYQRDYEDVLAFLSSPVFEPLKENTFWKPFILNQRAKAHHFLGQQEELLQDTGELENTVGVQMGYREDAYFAWELLPLALTSAYAGKLDRAFEVMDRVLELREGDQMNSFDDSLFSVSRAWLLGMAGQRDEALAEIERLLNEPGVLNRKGLELDPEWDFFRDDERFNALANTRAPR